MSRQHTFSGFSIVSCGTLRPELRALEEEGVLDADRVLFTTPGLHEWPGKLEQQLGRQVQKGKKSSERVIVVYGAKCFIDSSDPLRDVDALIREQGANISRIHAANCVDMLAGAEERQAGADGQKVYWLTPGWLRHWRYIFRDWDRGKANETFPQHDKAILLDGVSFFEEYTQEHTDEVLAFSDWMKIPIEPHPVSLDRLRGLLLEQLERSV